MNSFTTSPPSPVLLHAFLSLSLIYEQLESLFCLGDHEDPVLTAKTLKIQGPGPRDTVPIQPILTLVKEARDPPKCYACYGSGDIESSSFSQS